MLISGEQDMRTPQFRGLLRKNAFVAEVIYVTMHVADLSIIEGRVTGSSF